MGSTQLSNFNNCLHFEPDTVMSQFPTVAVTNVQKHWTKLSALAEHDKSIALRRLNVVFLQNHLVRLTFNNFLSLK